MSAYKPLTKKRILDNIEIDKYTGCWIWKGSKVHGYGQLGHLGKSIRIHRLAWALFVGSIPAGRLVLHKNSCRRRACCNFRHLYVGTYSDNLRDLYATSMGRVVKHAVRKGNRRYWRNLKGLERTARYRKLLRYWRRRWRAGYKHNRGADGRFTKRLEK